MDSIHPEETVRRIVSFLKSTFVTAGFSKAVIGVSGGVDSATCCLLSIKALGLQNVFPVLMPYGIGSMQSTLDGMNFVQSVGIPMSNISRIDIKPAVDAFVTSIGAVDQLRRGNMMARARMIVLFDQAKKRQALVVGTENKSEHLLGYYTRFGDEASDVEPIRDLYKTQIYEIAKYVGVPETILSKKPTADLWPEQTDEGEFGFTYKEADEILFQLYDQKKSLDEIKNFPKELVEKVKKRVEDNAFKHHLPFINSSAF